MATEGAGGLSTTAIEAAIDHWATHRHEAVVRDVEARAELAALVGRVAALEGALLHETARRLWTERVLQDRHRHPVGWDWDVGPAVREHWTRVARGRLGYARTVETLAELLARRGADAGRAATLAAENAALREALAEFGGRLREIEGTTAVLQRAHAAPADTGPGAAGARDETAEAWGTARSVLRSCARAFERDGIVAPEDAEVRALCERVGYGAVMDSAARQWPRALAPHGEGAFVVGPTRAEVWAALDALRDGGAG
jgi:hypothetical protein